MHVILCDICAEQINSDAPDAFDERYMKANSNGIFQMDYRPLVLDAKKKPDHFGYMAFNMCPMCTSRVSRAILETIAKIRESTYHATAVIEIGKFPPDPEEASPATRIVAEGPAE